MPEITPRSQCRAFCMSHAGDKFSETTFASAYGKFGRHVRNKYGRMNWKEEVAENGDLSGVLHFYIETDEGVVATFNRQTAANCR